MVRSAPGYGKGMMAEKTSKRGKPMLREKVREVSGLETEEGRKSRDVVVEGVQ